MKIRKILFSLLYLITPSVLATLAFFGTFWTGDYLPFIVFHVISVIGIILFIIFKPCKSRILLISMIIPILPLIMGVLLDSFDTGGFITTFLIIAIIITAYFTYCVLPYIFIFILALSIQGKIKGKNHA